MTERLISVLKTVIPTDKLIKPLIKAVNKTDFSSSNPNSNDRWHLILSSSGITAAILVFLFGLGISIYIVVLKKKKKSQEQQAQIDNLRAARRCCFSISCRLLSLSALLKKNRSNQKQSKKEKPDVKVKNENSVDKTKYEPKESFDNEREQTSTIHTIASLIKEQESLKTPQKIDPDKIEVVSNPYPDLTQVTEIHGKSDFNKGYVTKSGRKVLTRF